MDWSFAASSRPKTNSISSISCWSWKGLVEKARRTYICFELKRSILHTWSMRVIFWYRPNDLFAILVFSIFLIKSKSKSSNLVCLDDFSLKRSILHTWSMYWISKNQIHRPHMLNQSFFSIVLWINVRFLPKRGSCSCPPHYSDSNKKIEKNVNGQNVM